MSKKLILIRHGQSVWNFEKKYTGWANVPLTKLGIEQSKKAGKLFLKNKIIPDISFTSIQKRSIDTNMFILNELEFGKNKIKVYKNWRLNERHYGKLTGLKKDKIKWIGGFYDVPPKLNIKNITKDITVNVINYNPIYGESHYMTHLRVLPFWNFIKRKFKTNNTILICSHKNTLRVLIKEIENINDQDFSSIIVDNCIPIIYNFNNDLTIYYKTNLI